MSDKVGHFLDVILFRASGFLLLYNEAKVQENAEWEVIVAAICLFFMPDAIRGKNSIPIKILERFIGTKDEK